MTQLALDLALFSVHCFTCPHTVVAGDPQAAHDEMERHYAAKHAALIRRLAGG